MLNIDSIENRIRQIEQKIDRGPSVDSAVFNEMMGSQTAPESNPAAKGVDPNAALGKLSGMSMNGVHLNPFARPSNARDVQPMAQSNGVSCGQTSVAMCINSLTGKSLTDMDIDQKYGFGLMNALKAESTSSGYDWRDNGNLSADTWPLIDQKVNQEKLPVIVALNGPEFSPSGRGHIVTIVKTEGDTVTYADPADGSLKTTSKQNMQNASSHPDGNFVFVADRLNATPPVTPAAQPMAAVNPYMMGMGMNPMMNASPSPTIPMSSGMANMFSDSNSEQDGF